MQLLFVDESGTAPPVRRQHDVRFFVLGGLVVPEDVWAKVANDLRALKESFSIEGEIKWRYFAPQREGARQHTLSHLTRDQKEEVRTRLYRIVSGYKSIRLICVATHVPTAYKQSYIRDADDLYWFSYKQLTERFQYYLQDLERTVGQRIHGIIVCDHRAPKDDCRLREMHEQLLTSAKSNFSRYENLIEGLFIAPSHLSVGIQLADMVAGAVFRSVAYGDRRFIEQIRSSFRTSPAGRIEGYGLVKYPKGRWE